MKHQNDCYYVLILYFIITMHIIMHRNASADYGNVFHISVIHSTVYYLASFLNLENILFSIYLLFSSKDRAI